MVKVSPSIVRDDIPTHGEPKDSKADILYSIGLSWTAFSDRPKRRSVVCNPLVVLTISLVCIVARVIMVVFKDNPTVLLVMGDQGQYFGITFILNTYIGIIAVIQLVSQLIFTYNHLIGIKPTFLTIIESMSTTVPHDEKS